MDANNKDLKTRVVFIDTCAFIGKNLNFGLYSLGKLQSFIEQDKIYLLLPDITKMEIENHIKLMSEEAHKKLKKTLKNDRDVKILKGAKGIHLSGDIDIPTSAEINKSIIENFHKFIDSPNVEIVSTESVSSKLIFDNYFNDRPPFDNPKKKCEFPDAFVLEALNNISQSRQFDLYLVSTDPDLKSYGDSKSNFIFLNDINNLNDLIIHNDKELSEPAKFADSTFDLLKNKILKIAEETLAVAEFDDSEYSENVYDDIIHNVEIQAVKIHEKNIQEVSATKAIFQVNFEVELTALLVIPDLSNSAYDPETHRYIKYSFSTIPKEYKKIYSAHISINYDDGIKRDAKIVDFSFDDTYFELS